MLDPERRFPPHMRGCTDVGGDISCPAEVSPAHAGMYRSDTGSSDSTPSFPRTCGDVPQLRSAGRSSSVFPPHMRGCTVATGKRSGSTPVSPAHAGMYLRQTWAERKAASFPRTCGDVPVTAICFTVAESFPPHMRGCTRIENYTKRIVQFPPHMRGCTRTILRAVALVGVSPAHAGMYRITLNEGGLVCSFPRTCGDVPVAEIDLNHDLSFPPHMRGCTRNEPH